MWLQQGHEGQAMDVQMRAKCEVFSCKKVADSNRRRAARTSEVRLSGIAPNLHDYVLLYCTSQQSHKRRLCLQGASITP